jgi:hypothetical protein
VVKFFCKHIQKNRRIICASGWKVWIRDLEIEIPGSGRGKGPKRWKGRKGAERWPILERREVRKWLRAGTSRAPGNRINAFYAINEINAMSAVYEIYEFKEINALNEMNEINAIYEINEINEFYAVRFRMNGLFVSWIDGLEPSLFWKSKAPGGSLKWGKGRVARASDSVAAWGTRPTCVTQFWSGWKVQKLRKLR